MPIERLIATRDFPYNGKTVKKGDPFKPTKPYDNALFQAAEFVEPRKGDASAQKPARRRRAYKRRDMQAE